MFIKLFKAGALFFLVSLSLEAQVSFVPGYQLFNQICLEKNPRVREFYEAIESAEEAHESRNHSKFHDAIQDIEIKLIPHSDSETSDYEFISINFSSDESTGELVPEILAEPKEPDARKLKTNDPLATEFAREFFRLLGQSRDDGVEALYLRPCKSGTCVIRGGTKRFKETREQDLPPVPQELRYTIEIINKTTGQKDSFDLSNGILGMRKRYSELNGEQHIEHRDEDTQCLHFHCTDEYKKLEFERLPTEQFEWVAKNLGLLVSRTLRPSSDDE